jgi:hypothetical protein
MKRILYLAFAITALLLTARGYSQVLRGPFVPGSGQYSIIPGGDFETGDMAGWADSAGGQPGAFTATKAAAFAGGYGAQSTVTTSGVGAGFGAGRLVEVQPGQTYILSAFFITEHVRGRLYVDLGDVSFEPHMGTSGGVGGDPQVAQWQFAYAAFTVPADVLGVRVRLSHDSVFTPGDYGYVDDVAITPVAQFRLPTRLPIASIEVSEVTICWLSEPETMYQVQYRSELTTNLWVNLGPAVAGDGTRQCTPDAVTSAQRFYQVIILP